MHRAKIIGMPLLLALAACSASYDMQGVNPKDYYAKHPIQNTLETRHAAVNVRFSERQQRLSSTEIEALRGSLKEIAPSAAEAIVIESSRMGADRKKHLQKLVRSFGYDVPVTLRESQSMGPNEAVIDITYIAIIPPNCPDWRKSPVTNYSNTAAANYGCASTVNLGLTVANPRDLVKGQGTSVSDVERSSKALSDYRSNAATAASGSQ